MRKCIRLFSFCKKFHGGTSFTEIVKKQCSWMSYMRSVTFSNVAG